MHPFSITSFLQILNIVAIFILATTESYHSAEALDSNNGLYGGRVQRAQVVSGVTSRHRDRHLRNGQHQKPPQGSRKQRTSAEFIQGQRVTKTLHTHLYNETHETKRNSPSNDYPHQERNADTSTAKQRERVEEHNNLRKREDAHNHNSSQESTTGVDSPTADEARKAANDALARVGPTTILSNTTASTGVIKKDRN